MKNITKIFLLVGVFVFSACELDYLESPNDVTLASADPAYLLNRIQTDFASFYAGTSSRGARTTRIRHQASDTYEISYQAVSQDGTWNNAYSNLLNDIKNLKVLAEDRGFKRHLGMAKTMEAYIWMTLVDQFGDIPFSEALNPDEFNPVADNGSAVYTAAFDLLVSAKADFQATSIGTPNDYFYANNATKWIRLVNTMMLKYHLNRKLVDAAGSTAAINALNTENNYLGVGDDFVFKYGISVADPDSRHPDYSGQFPNGGGDYQSTYYMWHLTEAKKTGGATPGDASPSPDPRAHYYFYRQTGVNTTSASERECVGAFPPSHYPVDMVWCFPGTRGYWGRDHLDPDGIPPDGLRRTLYGIYPAGGPFDNNNPASISSSLVGNRGAGIQPIMLAAFADFMRAEAALTLGTSGDAKALLVSAITKHINYVRTWSLTTNEAAKITAFIPSGDHDIQRANYLSYVSNEYDAANAAGKLRVIAREYWIALYGNGVEAYNLYRRTGQPDGMQPGEIASFGDFPRSFFYPAVYVVRNRNADQKDDHNVQVFWDTNPAGFID
ncbi:MAG: SusD/RagB family nutrient-binding outer membrane lipoprotein [Cyclobacteriaceae bacterium]|nr:SusD/RagB family nutrient-binding outer membrane lipoprotein [Cyclobacteriaceae bacterium]